MYPQHLHELLSASLDYDAEVYRNYRCSHLSPRLAHNKPNSGDTFVARLPDPIANFVGSSAGVPQRLLLAPWLLPVFHRPDRRRAEAKVGAVFAGATALFDLVVSFFLSATVLYALAKLWSE